ncbi:carbohydrate kinase family protein [Salinactinospora qingdaonensis]|uniref:Carbohydrate kinase PfkB domain-containing protein n=1 Tax=Salinactinospora qingdaonensis TaxID=702744 RepID=A0ABP7FAQ9_9ACTN
MAAAAEEHGRASRIVVAGVASLGIAVGVDGFPLTDGPTRFPEWMRTGVTGVGANVAGALRRLGDEVEFCTVIGADPPGDFIRAELRTRGLLGAGAIVGPASSLAVSFAAPDGSRAGHSLLTPVNEVDYPAEVFAKLADGADLAVMTTAGFTEPLLAQARRLGVRVAVDVHLIADVYEERRRPWLNAADILFCSHERLPCAPREWITQVFATYPGCGIAAVGCGPEGCVLGLRDGTLVRARAAPPRGVRNPVGAGDTLFASFVHSWLGSGRPVEALRQAVVHAGYTIGDCFPAEGHLSDRELRELASRHPVEVWLGRWR